jgi:predicted Zn finger-like uncharacterized protein
MLLACPSCETQFQVADTALGAEGRTVRCAQCRHRWFATAVMAEPAMAEPVMAESAIDEPAMAAAIGDEAAPVAVDLDQVDWAEAEPVEIENSPPLAAELPPEITIASEDRPAGHAGRKRSKKTYPVRSQGAKRGWISRPMIAFAAAVGFFAAALGARASIVGVMPDLAGLYAAIGFPVNLRGLEFRDVKTTREMQDGIPVLVIQGKVVNVAKHPVEIPRVRLAVLGSDGQELYSWTTLLQRSILGDDEKVAFRSRLASPPPNGQKVLVRFLTRADLTGGR